MVPLSSRSDPTGPSFYNIGTLCIQKKLYLYSHTNTVTHTCQHRAASTLQRKSYLCISFLGITRPQSQFPHSCVCERFIYSKDRSTYFLQHNRQIDGGNNKIAHRQKCGNWDSGSAIPFLGIFFSNFRYWFFAV
jgi:hypothetical protein